MKVILKEKTIKQLNDCMNDYIDCIVDPYSKAALSEVELEVATSENKHAFIQFIKNLQLLLNLNLQNVEEIDVIPVAWIQDYLLKNNMSVNSSIDTMLRKWEKRK